MCCCVPAWFAEIISNTHSPEANHLKLQDPATVSPLAFHQPWPGSLFFLWGYQSLPACWNINSSRPVRKKYLQRGKPTMSAGNWTNNEHAGTFLLIMHPSALCFKSNLSPPKNTRYRHHYKPKHARGFVTLLYTEKKIENQVREFKAEVICWA